MKDEADVRRRRRQRRGGEATTPAVASVVVFANRSPTGAGGKPKYEDPNGFPSAVGLVCCFLMRPIGRSAVDGDAPSLDLGRDGRRRRPVAGRAAARHRRHRLRWRWPHRSGGGPQATHLSRRPTPPTHSTLVHPSLGRRLSDPFTGSPLLLNLLLRPPPPLAVRIC